MLKILKTLNEAQWDAIESIAIVSLCLAFVLGYGLKAATDYMDAQGRTWNDVVKVMPAHVKQRVAVEYLCNGKWRGVQIFCGQQVMDSNK